MVMQRVAPTELRYLGPLRAAALFRAKPNQVEPLGLEVYKDNLDSYSAAFFVCSGVAVTVQRHEGNEPDMYSVMFDAAAAHGSHLTASTLTSQILYGLLDLRDDSVVWRLSDDAFH